MSVDRLPWAVRFGPRTTQEIADNKEAINELRLWLRKWEKGIPEKRAVFLHGPPGVGKTSSVHVLAVELGFDLLEINASDYRTRTRMEEMIGRASTQNITIFGRRLLILFDEMEGISGHLEPSIPASQYARLNQAIEEFYGRGGRGMLRRIGKASFQYGIREQSGLLGVAGMALKLLPERQRIKFILNGMADALKKSNAQVNAWVDESGDRLAYTESTCAICHSRQSADPICHLYVGSITEAVHWATGKEYQVTETHFLAKGDE